MKLSAAAALPKVSNPPKAMGSTKTLMASRYSGKAQAAVRTSRSRGFCTTSTWNCRGRSMTAVIEISSIARPARVGRGRWRVDDEQARPLRVLGDRGRRSSVNPSKRLHVTTRADQHEGDELDDRLHRHRGHEAGLLPREIEVARAEEDAEDAERDRHQQRRVEAREDGIAADHHAERDAETAFSCSAMYGIIPHTTSAATSVPSGADLP